MKKLLVFIIGLLFVVTSSYAQYGNPNCPGDSSACTDWDSTVVNQRVQLSHEHDQYAYVTYRFRYCNGILEFFIDSIQVVDNAGHLREFNIQHYDFATLRSVIELGLITEHERFIGIDSLPPYNPLDSSTFRCEDTVSLVNFYSATCGIFLSCKYWRADSTRVCDSGYVAPYPEDPFEGFRVEITKWQSCGTNCCKRTYKVCRDLSAPVSLVGATYTRNRMLRIVSTNIESISWCSEQGKYGKTCYTNCWNTP